MPTVRFVPGIFLDTTASPVLLVRFDGVVDDDTFARYISELRAFVAGHPRYAVLLDATTAGVPTASQRRMQTDYIKADIDILRRKCAGGAFVIPSPVVRGGLTAMMWVQQLPFPWTLVPDVAAAQAWCRRQLAGADTAA